MYMTPRFLGRHLAGQEAPPMYRGRMIEAIRPISFMIGVVHSLSHF
jgi:hypothetical protein